MHVQRSSHGAGRYSLQVFDDDNRLLADTNVNQGQRDTGAFSEEFADGVCVLFTYNPVKVLAVLKDGMPYTGQVRRRQKTAMESSRWYLVHLEAELGITD